MELEVVKLAKVEKSTESGIVNLYQCVLKGQESNKDVLVTAKLTLECEEDPTVLDHYVKKMIGDRRIMSLGAANHTLDEFPPNP